MQRFCGLERGWLASWLADCGMGWWDTNGDQQQIVLEHLGKRVPWREGALGDLGRVTVGTDQNHRFFFFVCVSSVLLNQSLDGELV